MATALSDADWQALCQRLSQGGLYGVITTGIFCRFGCGARRPLRANAIRLESPAEAIALGLRPCKRCCPDVRKGQDLAP
ncbi:Ada metal-binding domain-containing protein [Pseudotabrizicola sp. L79]|uniref:Ada metal-binding domain-containing protein n=1 Tax=Pseudotabrizicola sp. L79 TaxID=3118402 RepID=UPI004053E525